MNKQTTEQKFCKKLVYKNTSPELKLKPTVILGIIKFEDNNFILFQTARKEYRISKSCIISIEDTEEEFCSNGGGNNEQR
jgi:hypothetical protein